MGVYTIVPPLLPSLIQTKVGGYITAVFGDKGVGKSSFFVKTADVATPLTVANFDRDLSHLLKQYKGATIDLEVYQATTNMQQAKQACQRFETQIARARKTGGIFAIDNGSGMWDNCKMAWLPTPESGKIYPKEFGDANSWMRMVHQQLEDSNLWPIITYPAVEIWKSQSVGTGLYTYEGWKHTDLHLVNSVYLFCAGKPMGVSAVPTETSWPLQYRAQIVDSKLDPTVQGAILDNPTFRDVLDATGLL